MEESCVSMDFSRNRTAIGKPFGCADMKYPAFRMIRAGIHKISGCAAAQSFTGFTCFVSPFTRTVTVRGSVEETR